jgi:hypothetical protein
MADRSDARLTRCSRRDERSASPATRSPIATVLPDWITASASITSRLTADANSNSDFFFTRRETTVTL